MTGSERQVSVILWFDNLCRSDVATDQARRFNPVVRLGLDINHLEASDDARVGAINELATEVHGDLPVVLKGDTLQTIFDKGGVEVLSAAGIPDIRPEQQVAGQQHRQGLALGLDGSDKLHGLRALNAAGLAVRPDQTARVAFRGGLTLNAKHAVPFYLGWIKHEGNISCGS